LQSDRLGICGWRNIIKRPVNGIEAYQGWKLGVCQLFPSESAQEKVVFWWSNDEKWIRGSGCLWKRESRHWRVCEWKILLSLNYSKRIGGSNWWSLECWSRKL
jgi:hypothetical protein